MARIGLVVDNPSRDLKGLLLVARHLARHGHEAILIPMYSQGLDVPLMGLDAIVLNYARDANRGLIEAYQALGIHVAILDTEGGIVSQDGADSPFNWATRMKRDGFDKLIQTHFFWGREIHTAFEKYSGIAGDRLFVTGCPRYDFTSPKWRDYFEYPHHDFVLLNTNFSAINPNFSQSAEQEMQAFLKSGWERSYVETLLTDWKLVMGRMLDVFADMFKARPQTLFVLRPHPFENPNFYREKFKAFPNLKVVTEGDVFQAIAHSTCVVHLNCGTAIESLLMETLPINVEFANTDLQRHHTPLPRLLSANPMSLDELLEVVDQPEGRRAELSQKIDEFIKPWFGPLDGKASERVADVLNRVVQTAAKSTRSFVASIRSGRVQFSIGTLVQGVVANILGSFFVAKLREWQQPARKVKSFDVARLVSETEKYEKYDPIGTKLKIRHSKHPLTGLPLSSISITATGAHK